MRSFWSFWEDVISFGHQGLDNVFVSLLLTPWYPWCFWHNNVRCLHFFGRPFVLTSNLKPTRVRRVCSTLSTLLHKPLCTFPRHFAQSNFQKWSHLKHLNSIAMTIRHINHAIISFFSQKCVHKFIVVHVFFFKSTRNHHVWKQDFLFSLFF